MADQGRKTVFPAKKGNEVFNDIDEVIEKYNSLVDSNDRRGKEAKRPVKHSRRQGKEEEKIEYGEITETRKELEELENVLEEIPERLKDRLRDKSPGNDLREKFKIESSGEDKVFGGQAPTGVSPDHIVPFSEIVKMDGFPLLDEIQMVKVLNWKDNLIAMDTEKNSRRGNRRWQVWKVDAYSLFDASVSHEARMEKIDDMIEKENKLRAEIEDMIHALGKKRLGL